MSQSSSASIVLPVMEPPAKRSKIVAKRETKEANIGLDNVVWVSILLSGCFVIGIAGCHDSGFRNGAEVGLEVGLNSGFEDCQLQTANHG